MIYSANTSSNGQDINYYHRNKHNGDADAALVTAEWNDDQPAMMVPTFFLKTTLSVYFIKKEAGYKVTRSGV